LALAYVLAVWIVAEGITLWMYLAFSLEPFSDLVAASSALQFRSCPQAPSRGVDFPALLPDY
jgi:hypothetical protein